MLNYQSSLSLFLITQAVGLVHHALPPLPVLGSSPIPNKPRRRRAWRRNEGHHPEDLPSDDDVSGDFMGTVNGNIPFNGYLVVHPTFIVFVG